MSRPSLRVLATGPLSLVQDLGRPGLAGVGVGRSGAADRGSLRRANRALENDEGAAALEVTLGGLELEVTGATAWLCVTGAPCPVTVAAGLTAGVTAGAAGRAVGSDTVFAATPGAVVRLGPPARGLRSYVAVRGGIDVAPVLGSRSRDVLGGLGPEPLRAGDRLGVGPSPAAYPHVDALTPLDLAASDRPVALRAVRGPREAWLRDPEQLVATAWVASARSNRVGMRLDGPPLRPAPDAPRLPSEGAWRGAVQVPPGGEPVLFLADHPVTGGYPVVAVVVDADVDRAAQVRPGQPVALRWVRPPG